MQTITQPAESPEFARRAPATAYVLRTTARVPLLPEGPRLALFAVAALADNALYSNYGYEGHLASEVAAVTGRTLLKTKQALTRLEKLGMLEFGGQGSASNPLYKIPQAAFDYANEV